MKHSIRFKLLIYMLVSVLFFTVLLIISNTFLVEKYYLEKTKRELLNTGQEIENLVQAASYDAEQDSLKLGSDKWESVTQAERTSGQSVLIEGPNGDIFYPINISRLAASYVTIFNDTGETDDSGVIGGTIIIPNSASDADDETKSVTDDNIYTEIRESIAEDVIISVRNQTTLTPDVPHQVIARQEDGAEFLLTEDSSLKLHTLSYRKPLANGLTMQISTPMSVISEGVAISSRFSTIIGFVTILFTVLWSLFISHRFTKPIKQMSVITSHMAGLDFHETIHARGSDELSQLAGNINELSQKLDTTIKELNLRNEKLSEEVDRERRIDKMRRDFISSVSHELKTPIFLIQGYADGLKSSIAKAPEKRDFYCNVIIDEAEKMSIIVKDLLSIAKYESGTVTIQPKPFRLNEFIRGVLEKYEVPAEKKELHLDFQPEADLTVTGDPFKLEQVLTNYVNNAVEYVDKHRQIQITLGITSPEKVRICVFNSGEPLSEETQELIWNSFYKADPSRTRSIGGAGLGLSIVKTIMEAHGEDFGTYNRDDGVVFWFELPVSTL